MLVPFFGRSRGDRVRARGPQDVQGRAAPALDFDDAGEGAGFGFEQQRRTAGAANRLARDGENLCSHVRLNPSEPLPVRPVAGRRGRAPPDVLRFSLGGSGAANTRPPPLKARAEFESCFGSPNATLACCRTRQHNTGSIMKHKDLGPRIGLFSLIFLSISAVAIGTIYPKRFPALTAFADWQDLAGAALALLAAAYAANYVKDQIAQADRLADEQRQRRLRAQRAVMPLTLSYICDYAETSLRELRRIHAAGRVGPDFSQIAAPTMDGQHVSEIRQMIEVEDELKAAPYADLLSELQIHSARWRGFAVWAAEGTGFQPAYIEGQMLDAAEIYARASNLVAAVRPARSADAHDHRPMGRLTALQILNIRGPSYAELQHRARLLDQSTPLGALETERPQRPASR